jgi:ribosomal-protein-alanine N-acetyltransferase
LLLRPPRNSDAAAFFGFLGDAEAMRFTHSHASLKACRARLAGFEWQRRRHGYAPWAVVLQQTGAVIGRGGVYQDPFDRAWGPELGYALHPAAWGRGYASELAQASLDWSDRTHRLDEIKAFTHPENTASARVLAKAGFAPVRFVAEMNRMLHRRTRRID